MMRFLTAALIASLTLMFALVPAASAQIAVEADTVHTATGDAPIVDGVVLVSDGTIEAVGSAADLSVPADYETITTEVVTPGFVDPRATAGFSGIYNVEDDQDQLDTSSPLQPHLRAIDGYNPQEELVEFLRQLGVTTLHTGHGPGALMSGQTGIFKTVGRTVNDAVVDAETMVALTMGQSVSSQFDVPGTRPKGVAMLRGKLLEAQQVMENGEIPDDLEMQTLVRILDGELPALITVHKAHEIQSALRLAEEFDFELILDGAAEAHQLIDEIAEADVPVILHPTMIRTGGAAENAAFDTAGKLHEAGISFAIQSGYEAYVPKTRVVHYEAAIAMAHGLPRDAALQSITRDAAEIIGVDDQVGTIEEGKDADLALFEGDPFEYVTRTCTVIVGGEVVSDECL